MLKSSNHWKFLALPLWKDEVVTYPLPVTALLRLTEEIVPLRPLPVCSLPLVADETVPYQLPVSTLPLATDKVVPYAHSLFWLCLY